MSGKAKGAYKKRKIAVKTFMWSVAVINIYLYAIGRASMIGGLGLMLVLIITPTLYVGGSSLVKILDSQLAGERLKAKEEKERQIAEDVKAGVGGGSAQKPFMNRFLSGELDLPGLINRTQKIFLFAVPFFFMGALGGFSVMAKRKSTGRRDLLAGDERSERAFWKTRIRASERASHKQRVYRRENSHY